MFFFKYIFTFFPTSHFPSPHQTKVCSSAPLFPVNQTEWFQSTSDYWCKDRWELQRIHIGVSAFKHHWSSVLSSSSSWSIIKWFWSYWNHFPQTLTLRKRDPLVTEGKYDTTLGKKSTYCLEFCDPVPPLLPFTTQSPRCVCSATPPEPSWGGWPGWVLQWRDPRCDWVGPWEADQTASSHGSSACGLGWRTHPPACWARSTPSSVPPGTCSLSARRRARLCPPSYTTVSGPALACPVWIWPSKTPQWRIHSVVHTPVLTHTETLR